MCIRDSAGVDPTHFYTTRTLAEAFLAACDKERMEGFAPLFTGSSTAGQAALAALLPNTFLQALVWRTLTAPALPASPGQGDGRPHPAGWRCRRRSRW